MSINNKTPERLADLTQTISDTSRELEQLFYELTEEADDQMASAAQAFIAEHADPNRLPFHGSYVDTHRSLVKATIAASNIRELSKRATDLHFDCASCGNDLQGKQHASDIRAVCERTAPAEGADDRDAERS